MAVIRAQDVSFTYPGARGPALQSLSFDVQQGEIFGFLGPSGAGKSTAQKILIRLLQGYSGEISILDTRLDRWGASLYERVGVAFEYPNHFLKLTGRENLVYFARLFKGRGCPLDELLERLDLLDAADRRVETYSKGMKTRLSVARSLVHDPDLLFYDEPTGGLDPVNALAMKELIRDQAASGKTVFLTTHDMAVADQLCDRVAFLVGGEIRVVDSPRELKLAHGRSTLQLEVLDANELRTVEFSMANLADDPAFLNFLRSGQIQTMHTQEASLEDVFVAVTGRALR